MSDFTLRPIDNERTLKGLRDYQERLEHGQRAILIIKKNELGDYFLEAKKRHFWDSILIFFRNNARLLSNVIAIVERTLPQAGPVPSPHEAVVRALNIKVQEFRDNSFHPRIDQRVLRLWKNTVETLAPGALLLPPGISNTSWSRCYFNSTISALLPLRTFCPHLEERRQAFQNFEANLLANLTPELENRAVLSLADIDRKEYEDFAKLSRPKLRKIQEYLENKIKIDNLLEARELVSDPEEFANRQEALRNCWACDLSGGVKSVYQTYIQRNLAATPAQKCQELERLLDDKLEALSADDRAYLRTPEIKEAQTASHTRLLTLLQQVKEHPNCLTRNDEAELTHLLDEADQEAYMKEFGTAVQAFERQKKLLSLIVKEKNLIDKTLVVFNWLSNPLNDEILSHSKGPLKKLLDSLEAFMSARTPSGTSEKEELTFTEYKQRDAQEFFLFLQNALFPSNTFLVSENTLIPTIPVSTSHETPSFLNFEIPEGSAMPQNIPLSIARMFQEHPLPLENQEGATVSGIRLENAAPDILPIQVGRFTFGAGGAGKATDRVEIPRTLSVPLIRNDPEHPDLILYALRSVVIHMGGKNVGSGHYFTFEPMRTPDGRPAKRDGSVAPSEDESDWIEHNDAHVGYAKYRNIKDIIEQNAYLVFYEKT